MVELKGVSFSYTGNSREVLTNINFHVNKGNSIGIIGANGAGKSTLLKLLVGLELGYNGEITVYNLKVNKKNLPYIRKKIGYVFQDSESQLFMPTVYENVIFGPRNYGFSKEEAETYTLMALKSVGLEELKDIPIYHLSGGQKKLAAIATVLSMKPDLLIFDEPTVALDPKNRRRFIEVLNSLKVTKIVATHDLDLVYDTCEKTILISEGNIIKAGSTKLILEDKELLENNGLELPLSFSRS